MNYDRFINENKSDIDAYAVFAGVDYDLTDELTLQGSIRYTHSKRKFAGCLRDSGGQIAAGDQSTRLSANRRWCVRHTGPCDISGFTDRDEHAFGK